MNNTVNDYKSVINSIFHARKSVIIIGGLAIREAYKIQWIIFDLSKLLNNMVLHDYRDCNVGYNHGVDSCVVDLLAKKHKPKLFELQPSSYRGF